MSEKSAPLPHRVRLLDRKRAFAGIIATLVAVFLLAACASETAPATTAPPPTAEPTAVPTSTPTPTAIPYQEFASAVIPPADPERLAQLIKLLSLVPETFSSTVYLDMEFLRSNEALAALVNPEVLGMDVAIPSIATGLVDSIAVAADFRSRSVVTPFQSNFAIADMLRLAGGFGLQLGGDGPTSYEGHDVWDINVLGTVLAMAEADETAGIAASGQGLSPDDVRALVEASLDGFDGRSATLLDAPGLAELLANVPSGFAASAISQCETLPLFVGIPGLPGCTGVVVTASILPSELVVFHALIGFSSEDGAAAAIERAVEALEGQNRSHEFEDLGVRQEGGNLRVRVIVELPKFSEVFRLFTPDS